MTTVPPTEQRTLGLLNRHHDDEVKRAAKITDKVGRIGVWLHERTARAELTLAMIDQVVNDLSTEREALADALENVRCYEALLDRTGGVQPVEAAARAAVKSSQPLPVLCECDVHDRHPECGPDCPCNEQPATGPGPNRTSADTPEPVRTSTDASEADLHNQGRPVEWIGRDGTHPGVLVCAVPSPPGSNKGALGHGARLICGTPVDQHPCPQHGMTAAAGQDGAA